MSKGSRVAITTFSLVLVLGIPAIALSQAAGSPAVACPVLGSTIALVSPACAARSARLVCSRAVDAAPCPDENAVRAAEWRAARSG